jgi:D-sedoheptulose 7-phosphate isomerase
VAGVHDTAAVRTVERVLDDAVALHQRVRAQSLEAVARAADLIMSSHRAGGKVLVFGNGGAQPTRSTSPRARWPLRAGSPAMAAVALTTTRADGRRERLRFERIFARQIEALGRAGTVAVAISTSGGSANGSRRCARLSPWIAYRRPHGAGWRHALGGMVQVHINVRRTTQDSGGA